MASLLHFFSARPAPGRPLARTRTPTWTAAAAEVEYERTRRADVLDPWYEAHRLRYRNQDPRVACGHRHGNVHEAAACAQRAMITGALADLNTGGHDPAWGVLRITPSGDGNACDRGPVVPQRVRHLSQLRRFPRRAAGTTPAAPSLRLTGSLRPARKHNGCSIPSGQGVPRRQARGAPSTRQRAVHGLAGAAGRADDWAQLPRSAPGTAEVSQS